MAAVAAGDERKIAVGATGLGSAAGLARCAQSVRFVFAGCVAAISQQRLAGAEAVTALESWWQQAASHGTGAATRAGPAAQQTLDQHSTAQTAGMADWSTSAKPMPARMSLIPIQLSAMKPLLRRSIWSVAVHLSGGRWSRTARRSLSYAPA